MCIRDRSRLRDRHAFPECNVTLDVVGGGFGRGVIPCRVFIDLAIDDDIVVTGGALPSAHGMRRAVAQKLAFHGIGGKILVAFDGYAALALLSLIHISEPTRLLSISYAV